MPASVRQSSELPKKQERLHMAKFRPAVTVVNGDHVHGRGATPSGRTVSIPMDGLMGEDRRTQILQIVRHKGRVRVNDLANRFGTSSVTVRNDLNELHERGLLFRFHGGAVIAGDELGRSFVRERLKEHSEERRRIGAMAATLINDGDTIILDAGTTTLEIARHIKHKQELQVITNGVTIAAELLDAQGIHTFIAGGPVHNDSASILGRSTEEMFREFSADKLFLGAAGCDPDFSVSGVNLEEKMVKRAMMHLSREVVLVADASKFSKRSMSRIALFSEIHTIITDTRLTEETEIKLRAAGCNLMLA
jgi:DeoR/GlpR family transcriptional regulator of sugar metabolism